MKVPFIDLPAQCKAIKSEVMAVFDQAVDNAGFIGGPQVKGFEEEFAHFCQTQYCVGVGSGTDAIRFALLAAGIGPGDEVITVPNTFIATTEAISQTGATIGFVDIDPKTYNLDPQKLEDYLKKRNKVQGKRIKDATHKEEPPESLSLDPLSFNLSPSSLSLDPLSFNLAPPRPKAVLPVHLYGQPADMDSIMAIANRYDLIVIEDACQAHGAEYKGRGAGSIGIAGCFSFYPGKNLGAFGEAGAVTTNDAKMAEKITMLRDHGQIKKYYHQMEGYNGRLDAIQAGVLRIKLKHLAAWNEKRRNHARHYDELLKNVDGIVTPFEPSWAKGVFHLYVIKVKERDGFCQHLKNNGIDTGFHYPIPLHLQHAYQHQGYKPGDFPVTEEAARDIVSLPMFPELTNEQINYIAHTIKDCLR